MSKNTPKFLISKRSSYIILAVAAALFIVTSLFWWQNVYLNSNRVFWGMVSNNLSTSSITKHNVQAADGQSNEQATRVSFGPVSASHGLVTVKQTGTTVKSETIGTDKNDYSRYVSIQTDQKNAQGKPIDSSKIIGVWGKSPDNTQTRYFQQGVLGVTLFANLNSSQRSSLVKQLRDKNVYSLGKVRSAKAGDRPVYIYEVDIKPQGLVGVLAQYAKYIGLGDIGLDPSQYAGSPPIQTEFTVDKLSRQLIKVHYDSNNLDEIFSSYGLDQPVSLPSKTIPISDLQNRVQQSLQ